MNTRFPATASCTFLLTVGMLLLASSCRKALLLQNPNQSPSAIFNEAWNVIDQRYALFPVKEADWSQIYSKYQQQTTGAASENTLFTTVSDMLGTLHDGHVSLLAPGKTYTYDN
ncbi:MAG: hypothetical protein H0X41_04300, partial [Chitinophagaceae bacterium]|nr:hypothetical protein [Chitinophagaceae bacterium]